MFIVMKFDEEQQNPAVFLCAESNAHVRISFGGQEDGFYITLTEGYFGPTYMGPTARTIRRFIVVVQQRSAQTRWNESSQLIAPTDPRVSLELGVLARHVQA